MNPTIGRIVHLHEYVGVTAALTVNVRPDNVVDLQVFRQDGHIIFLENVEQGDSVGQWNWPKRETRNAYT